MGRGRLRIGRRALMDSRAVPPRLSGRAGLAHRPQTHAGPAPAASVAFEGPVLGRSIPGLNIPYGAFGPAAPVARVSGLGMSPARHTALLVSTP